MKKKSQNHWPGTFKNWTLVPLLADFVNIQFTIVVRYIFTEREKTARCRSIDDCGWFVFVGG